VESASKYNNWGRLSKLKAKILHRQKTGAPGNALQGELEEVSETEKIKSGNRQIFTRVG
jgi:hypothetical protein